jgi:phosphoribosyl 1,2-cyclic phosphodiesterase
VDPASVDAVFLSHEHSDHSRGAASFSRKWGVRLSGTRGTYAAASLGASEIAGYDVLVPGSRRMVGALTVAAIPVPHDAAEPLAFVVSCGDVSFGHATDLGHLGRGLIEAFTGCQAVLVEANYDPGMLRDGPYPWSLKERILSPVGHLSNGDVASYLERGLPDACETVVLAHLSRKNNHPEVARMAAESAFRRRGRDDVRLEMTGPEGTGWIQAVRTSAASPVLGQMRLFQESRDDR